MKKIMIAFFLIGSPAVAQAANKRPLDCAQESSAKEYKRIDFIRPLRDIAAITIAQKIGDYTAEGLNGLPSELLEQVSHWLLEEYKPYLSLNNIIRFGLYPKPKIIPNHGQFLGFTPNGMNLLFRNGSIVSMVGRADDETLREFDISKLVYDTATEVKVIYSQDGTQLALWSGKGVLLIDLKTDNVHPFNFPLYTVLIATFQDNKIITILNNNQNQQKVLTQLVAAQSGYHGSDITAPGLFATAATPNGHLLTWAFFNPVAKTIRSFSRNDAGTMRAEKTLSLPESLEEWDEDQVNEFDFNIKVSDNGKVAYNIEKSGYDPFIVFFDGEILDDGNSIENWLTESSFYAANEVNMHIDGDHFGINLIHPTKIRSEELDFVKPLAVNMAHHLLVARIRGKNQIALFDTNHSTPELLRIINLPEEPIAITLSADTRYLGVQLASQNFLLYDFTLYNITGEAIKELAAKLQERFNLRGEE